jgi:hypothetical protein
MFKKNIILIARYSENGKMACLVRGQTDPIPTRFESMSETATVAKLDDCQTYLKNSGITAASLGWEGFEAIRVLSVALPHIQSRPYEYK